MRHLVTILMLCFIMHAGAVTEKEALDFLYSSMSLPDRTDYTEDFYRRNVKASLKAREEMPWGKSVPDREFLHFVLPVRVNNENLDMSREVFFDELKERVKGLSMSEAILEVNHWCHEKVTYRPSDARTSSPLSTVSQAIGRCGEESTFTVAALRSVGIPARQIYTPRWAHTDDNHAWVEAWADGKWHFIGACEPEPVLDMAWFNAPAARGLLMSTNVPGKYDGPEEVLGRDLLNTRINVTSNYAPTDSLRIQAVYDDNRPAAGAKVNFCIYNYSDFYPAVTKTADKEGRTSLRAGLGDMVVWATDGKKFGFAKGRPGQEGVLKVVLDKDNSWNGAIEFDIIPPVARATVSAVTPDMRAANDRRLSLEDSIRNAYTQTFADSASSARHADALGLDRQKLFDVLRDSRGNHGNIVECLYGLSVPLRKKALDLLLNVSEKDRRDIPSEVIADHCANSVSRDKAKVTDEIYNRYILSPRIENEGLKPWRAGLAEKLPVKQPDAEKLIAWINSSITISDNDNPQLLRMDPMSVLKGRTTDSRSRGIFFVAAARTLGIPARIDPVTGDTQYLDGNGIWQTVSFSGESADAKPTTSGRGTLRLTFEPSGHIRDPKYYSQFALIKISDGMARQLEYPEDGTASSLFAEPAELEAGQYMLVSGQRLADGGVLAHVEIFTVNPGESITKELKIRQDEKKLSVIGSLNAENIYHNLAGKEDRSLLSTTGRGYYVIGLISPNHEPSAHALNDIRAVAERLEETGASLMLLFDSADAASRFNSAAFPGMPSNTVFGIDKNNVSRQELVDSLHLENASYPIFAVADTFNRVVWVSTGYTIGIGDKLLEVLSAVGR